MNSPRNTPSKPHRRPSSKSTPIPLRKQTPGRQFVYRRQNRLLRSELATIQNRCSRMERTIAELNALLKEERDRTLQVVPADRTAQDLQNNLTAERTKCERLQFQLTMTRRENDLLRENVTGLTRQLVHQKQLREDYQKQHSVAVNNKTGILRSKLREAFRENGLLKVKIEQLEKVRTDLVRRHRTSLTNIKSTADELVSLIEEENAKIFPQVALKKFVNNFQ